MKNNYRFIALDLSRQKVLDADPIAIQQRKFVGQSKNNDGVNTDGKQSIFVLTILGRIK